MIFYYNAKEQYSNPNPYQFLIRDGFLCSHLLRDTSRTVGADVKAIHSVFSIFSNCHVNFLVVIDHSYSRRLVCNAFFSVNLFKNSLQTLFDIPVGGSVKFLFFSRPGNIRSSVQYYWGSQPYVNWSSMNSVISSDSISNLYQLFSSINL